MKIKNSAARVKVAKSSVANLNKTDQPVTRDSSALIMETAERLCAERGLEFVSIRDVATAANISISVIYHYYGSKANLLRAIVSARLTESGELRDAMLDEIDKDAKPDLHAILYALFKPLALWRSPSSGRQQSMQFLARSFISTHPAIQEELDASIQKLKRVVDLLARALPHLSRDDICWRLHFTMGVEHMNHWDVARLSILSEGACDGDNIEESLERAVSYVAAAFLAPSTEKVWKSRRPTKEDKENKRAFPQKPA